MLLSVDTGSIHLAAAVNCTVVGIFNGSQYKRFAPYPTELNQRFITVYSDEVELELNNEALVSKKYEFAVDIPYSNVTPIKVINLIKILI
jgi:ADP-heptose:LPS heptosyltransferase